MKKIFTLSLSILLANVLSAQYEISGNLVDDSDEPVAYANVVLYNSVDSSLVKVATSDNAGVFSIPNIANGKYYLSSTFVGYQDVNIPSVAVENADVTLGKLSFAIASTTLKEATVTAKRAMVEVKPDRTVFNVQGTINAIGSDGLALLRKAPGVVLDNNDNITVLGRNGVLVYVDGKRLPLGGEDLANYLRSLTADQIDKIDIITNPSAKYEAEGNAGIIDIRLKRDKSHGANGTISSSFSQGLLPQANLNANGNYRNKRINLFGSAGIYGSERTEDLKFLSTQNGISLDERLNFDRNQKGYQGRVGLDYFIDKNQTIGILLTHGANSSVSDDSDIINISDQETPETIDSILVANTDAERDFNQYSVNLNYQFESKDRFTLNLDLDYGIYRNDRLRDQPNEFYGADNTTLLGSRTYSFETPTDIDIATAKLDFSKPLLGGQLGLGTKLTSIMSDNSYLVFDLIDQGRVMDDRRSNIFDYNESIYAGYISYSRKINAKWSMSSGLRAEQTESKGDLTAFRPELEEDPVKQSYFSWFPSLGFTYSNNPNHVWGINYGRRINRPDYNVLNPFNNQLSEFSFEKGNPGLLPEIVNNIELSYTLKYRYNFKISYSQTTDQITRLIGPDPSDPRANFINWDNLAEQTIYNASVSLPFQISDIWSAYFNGSVSYKDNQADYGDGAVVDLQAFGYNAYQQHTFTLPRKFFLELSGWYSGPGIWGGVFRYDPSYSLNFGIQKRFLNDQLNVKLSVNDISNQAFWSGYSEFNGLYSEGRGKWDSRRVGINVSYNFGNQNVKSRKRKTGLEDEASRVSEN